MLACASRRSSNWHTCEMYLYLLRSPNGIVAFFNTMNYCDVGENFVSLQSERL